MNVTADHSVGAGSLGLNGQDLFEVADEIDCILDARLRPFRQRPVRQAKQAAQPVELRIGEDGEVVGFIAEMSDPARMFDYDIEEIAVRDEKAAAVCSGVNGVFDDLDSAKVRAVIVAKELVMIAGNIDKPRTFACLAQQLLNDVVVSLRPVPVGAQRPAVNDVANEIDGFGVVEAQEVDEFLGLRAARSEMNVGDKEAAIAADDGFVFQGNGLYSNLLSGQSVAPLLLCLCVSSPTI